MAFWKIIQVLNHKNRPLSRKLNDIERIYSEIEDESEKVKAFTEIIEHIYDTNFTYVFEDENLLISVLESLAFKGQLVSFTKGDIKYDTLTKINEYFSDIPETGIWQLSNLKRIRALLQMPVKNTEPDKPSSK